MSSKTNAQLNGYLYTEVNTPEDKLHRGEICFIKEAKKSPVMVHYRDFAGIYHAPEIYGLKKEEVSVSVPSSKSVPEPSRSPSRSTRSSNYADVRALLDRMVAEQPSIMVTQRPPTATTRIEAEAEYASMRRSLEDLRREADAEMSRAREAAMRSVPTASVLTEEQMRQCMVQIHPSIFINNQQRS